MKTITTIISTIFLSVMCYAQQKYYVDCSLMINGDGSFANPWNDLTGVNSHASFVAGDTIFIKRGTTCLGGMYPKGSGDITKQIVITTYGPDPAKPIIDAQGVSNSAGIFLWNQQYWTIDGLEITNNATTYDKRWGIFAGSDNGVMRKIRITNNFVRDVYASAIRSPSDLGLTCPSFYSVGGIYVAPYEPSHADDVLIEGNVVQDIVGQGISFWGENEFTNGMNWNNLSPNVVVRNNKIVRTASDGILILGTDNELVEYNLVDGSGALGVTPGTSNTVGMWPTRHRDGIWQYNEVRNTIKWIDDGEAFDNDVEVQGTTIFQYNYSHNNQGGFFLDCCGPDGGKTILRYNISVNETFTRLARFDRGGAVLYNNIFYAPGQDIYMLSYGTEIFSNNIFWGKSLFANSTFDHNTYYGGTSWSVTDYNSQVTDPMFVNPALAGNGMNTLNGFKLNAGSPCIGTGVLINNNGGKDFWGNPVSTSVAPNRGADNLGAITGMKNVPDGSLITVYPNPANQTVYISSADQIKTIEMFDIAGRLVSVNVEKQSDRAKLDVSVLDKGLYTIVIRTAENVAYRKLQVNN